METQTNKLKVGDVFLTTGVNLDSPFDKKLMAICTSVYPNGSIGFKGFSPVYRRLGGAMRITGYERKTGKSFSVEYVGTQDTVTAEIWKSLVELDSLFNK